ncbi:PaREP1 family protein [Vulcanisaeta sp. JCM 14467]|uniref:PaREP1 family protein n=1 Tax=Vulcanisaeta sp. JCM 14467 TaxID=1295370 RepID=UPI0006D0D051|nr:PaREP1 family protein [Vulcanisaeta sp. JCM 14467]
MSITPSPTISKLLRELAGDRDVEMFIIDLIAGRLDPPCKIELYLRLHEEYLKSAEELYAKGDLAQAGEKYWGAVTALLNIIGERLGMPHYSHRDLRELASYLTETTHDPEYTRLFSSAETLHANFYHGFLGKESFNAHRDDVIKLIMKLRTYLNINT